MSFIKQKLATNKIYREIDPLDKRNVIDEYKGLSNDEIRKRVRKNSLPISLLMFQLTRDYNFGSLIRNANALGARDVFYFGERKFDKRPTVGAENYLDVHYLRSFGELSLLKERFSFLSLEQDEKSIPLNKFNWITQKQPLLVIGEEGDGIPNFILDWSEYCLEINQRGSVRSINAAAAGSIALYDFASKYINNY